MAPGWKVVVLHQQRNQPPHPSRRPPRPRPITLRPRPPRPLLLHRPLIPAQALLPPRRHLAQFPVQVPLRPSNLPPRIARLKRPQVVSLRQAPSLMSRTRPPTSYCRRSSVLAIWSQLLNPSWSLNVQTLIYIPNAIIPLPL